MGPDPTPLPADIAALRFEDAYEELRTLTAELEAEELPLEESLQAYERATLLARHCQQLLTAAEERVQLLQDGAFTPIRDEDPG